MRGDTRPTILLVDDNPQIRSFIRPALEDNGFNCVEAVDGDEAVYQAEASHPDLIVLDIELGDPGMDGLDVCKRIRGLGLTMPVIFLTVRATAEDLEHGLRLAGPGSGVRAPPIWRYPVGLGAILTRTGFLITIRPFSLLQQTKLLSPLHGR